MAIDKASGQFSVFEVVEQVTYSPIDKPLDVESIVVVSQRPLKFTSGWMIQPEKGDRFEDEFEYEHRAITPSGLTIEIHKGTFKFAEGKIFHRIVISMDGMVPVDRSGTLYLEARIRKVGDETWVTQDFPVIVTIEGAPTIPSIPTS